MQEKVIKKCKAPITEEDKEKSLTDLSQNVKAIAQHFDVQ